MKIAEHRTDSNFLVRAENLHKLAELAWFEGRVEDMHRCSEEARELMEKYFSFTCSPEPPQESKQCPIHFPLPILDWILICFLVFLSTYGLILFLNSLQGFLK
jgi:hypothetical protein